MYLKSLPCFCGFIREGAFSVKNRLYGRLLNWLPTSLPAVTVVRVCGSVFHSVGFCLKSFFGFRLSISLTRYV